MDEVQQKKYDTLLAGGVEPVIASEVMIKKAQTEQEFFEALGRYVLDWVQDERNDELPRVTAVQNQFWRYLKRCTGTSNLIEAVAEFGAKYRVRVLQSPGEKYKVVGLVISDPG